MTPQPRSGQSGNGRSGQGRNAPRGAGAPRTGGAPRSGGSRFGGPQNDGDSASSSAPWSERSDTSGSDTPRSGAPRSSAARPGAPRAGAARGSAARNGAKSSGKFGAGKFGADKSSAGKFGAPKSGGPRKPAGPRAFAGERFGKSLGPVKTKKTPGTLSGNDADLHTSDGIRLQKIMASAGVASRRVCEEMIEAGRVEVDGRIVTELGLRVDPKQVTISVDGLSLQLDDSLVYMVFNKPKGVVSTMEDPEGRPCISDFLKKRQTNERLFHVGRLDVGTEGLLLLTNDGELANRLTHPKYEVSKTYLAQVRGPMGQGIGAQMKSGIELEDGTASVDSFKLVDSTPGHILVEVVLHSGKNRIVRRLFDAVGHPVERLVRVKMGPIALGDQRQGSIRVLGKQEVGHLLSSVGM